MLNEKEVLCRIKNKNLRAYYDEFIKLTSLNIEFENLDNRVRARYYYTDGSNIFRICLRSDWIEEDLAHELMHGKVMLVDKYGLVLCNNVLCQLIKIYICQIK